MSKPKDKDAAEGPRAKRPPGYRKFSKLLKQVINAPPYRKTPTGRDVEIDLAK